MAGKLPSIRIIRDSREKEGEGWFWEPEEKVAGKIQILGTEVKGLGAGDYSIEGFEDQIRIERKAGFCELFGDMTPVANRERFHREMEKLQNIKHKYLIIESNISLDVWGMSIPQFKFAPPCSRVFDWVIELQQTYGIVPIFAGDCGKKCAKKIFDRFIRANS